MPHRVPHCQFPLWKKYFLPFHFGKKPQNFTNTNIIIYFHAIHAHKKIMTGYSPHICWFAKILWGQMEETKIDLF